MDPRRFGRLRTIYEQAENLPSGERTDYLERACDGDTALLGEVRRMLSATMAPLFLERPAALDPPLESPPVRRLPEQVGPFHVRGLLGEGGFGVVYRAEQLEPVRRVVALKVLHPHRVDERSRLRFEAERQTLARMQHAGIAQIFDAGRTDDGLLYFAMELVDGLPVTLACDDVRAGVDARLELFSTICAAVQHAHQKGVVHRDLKPSNVIVRVEGGVLTPKIIDFGIAKLLYGDDDQEEAPGGTHITGEGMLLGTPGYMSPEQAAGRSVDTRTDVYALGVLLYDLLTGDLPFERERLATSHPAEIVRIVCEEEPRRLSAVLRNSMEAELVSALRGCDVDSLRKALRGDLEWIARKALAKDPEERYASVSELIADVDRYRRDEPVTAREPAARYLLRKFVVRHRLGVGLSVAALLTVLLGVAGLLWALDVVDQARDQAEEQRVAALLNEYAAHLAAARSALEIGDARSARLHLDATAEGLRGWEWRHLAAQCDQSSLSVDLDASLLDLHWLDAKRMLALGPSRADVVTWPSGTVDPWIAAIEPQVDDSVLDPAGQRLIVDLRERLEVWDLRSRDRRILAELQDDVRSMALAPDGRTLVTSDNGGAVRLFDLDGERPARVLCRMDAFSWDIQFLGRSGSMAFGTTAGRVEVRELETGRLERTLVVHRAEDVTALAAFADGTTLFAAAGRSLQRWNVSSGELEARRVMPLSLRRLELSPGEELVYGAGGWREGRMTAWDARTLEVVARFNGHREGVSCLAVHADGTQVVSGSFDGVLKLWPATIPGPSRLLEAGYDARDLSIEPDGTSFAIADSRGRVTVWDGRTLATERVFETGTWHHGCALGRDTVWVAGAELLALDRSSGDTTEGDSPSSAVARLEVDSRERWLCGAAAWEERLFVWSLPGMELVHELELPATGALAYDPATRCFVVGGRDGWVRFVDPRGGEIVQAHEFGGYTWDLDVTPDEIGATVSEVRLGIVDRARPVLWTSSRDSEISSLAFSPDGRRIATGSRERFVTILDRDDTELLVLDDAPKPVIELYFAGGGRQLVGLCYLPGSPTYVAVWEAPEEIEEGE